MQTLFDQKVHQDILTRIDRLTENSKPNWGGNGCSTNGKTLPDAVIGGKWQDGIGGKS